MNTSLQTIDRADLLVQPIEWCGMHREYLNAGEMEIIVALVRSAKCMIEIGCRDGRTAHVILQNVSTLERYIGVDVTQDYQPGLPHQRKEMVRKPGHCVDDPRFELVIRPRGSLDLDELEPCDAVFIDGDHSRSVVMRDTIMALNAIRKGGVVIWHDYFNDHINDVTDVLNTLGSRWPIQHIAGTWLAFCRSEG